MIKKNEAINLSVVLNTFNEAHHIADCIRSIWGIADEIIVSDMDSVDGSADIAKSLGCIVFSCKRQPVVEYTLIERIKIARGKWILMLDPDMRVPPITSKRITEIIQDDKIDGATFYMRNYILGRWCVHGHAAQGKFFKLFKRELFMKNINMGMGISFGAKNQLSRGNILHLTRDYYIDHYAYTDMHQMFSQHLRYANTIAREQIELGKQFSWVKLTLLPLKKFATDLIVYSAWKDGVPCIAYSLAAACMLFFKELYMWQYSNIRK